MNIIPFFINFYQLYKFFLSKYVFNFFSDPVDGPELGLGLGPGVSPGTRVEDQEEIEDQSPRIRIKVK